MKRQICSLTMLIVLFASLTFTAQTARASGAVTLELQGFITGINPCNGESGLLTGPLKLVYHENRAGGSTHYNIHLEFRATGTGDQGNDYRVSEEANYQFDAPTGTINGAPYFELPFHTQVISLGDAPNFSFEGMTRVTVLGGGHYSIQGVTATDFICHG